jgi:hypothetical protein
MGKRGGWNNVHERDLVGILDRRKNPPQVKEQVSTVRQQTVRPIGVYAPAEAAKKTMDELFKGL